MTNTKRTYSFFLAVTIFMAIPSAFALAYQAAPISITKSATFITEKSATLNGQVNPNGMDDTYQWFEWGISGQNNILYETKHLKASGVKGNILVNDKAGIIGLAPKTQYFYRQVSENSRGKDFGNAIYFTTAALPAIPLELVIVETRDPKVVAETTATLRGYVSPHGNTGTKVWFEWGQRQQLESRTSSKTVSANSGYFDSTLTNLTPGTMYYYRIVAENSAGLTYGAPRVFYTKGTPPPPPEAPRSQSLPSSQLGSDGVTRTTTSNGSSAGGVSSGGSASYNNSGDSAHGFPGVSAANRPGDILGLFRKKTTSETSAPTNTETTQASSGQVAGAATSRNPITQLWNSLTGGSKSNVTVEKVGPSNVPAHSSIEYRITYHYRESSVASDALLLIVIPSDVVYIGDNTNNELLLQEGTGNGERTYVLPIGRLEEGSTRTISILGMTTGSANGFPDARAILKYQNATGAHALDSGAASTGSPAPAEQVAASGSSDGTGRIGLLPSSIWGWLLYVLVIVLLIIGIRKGREYYERRKEEIASGGQEDDNVRLARMLPPSEDAPLEA